MEVSHDFRRKISVGRLRPAPTYSHPVTYHYEIHDYTTRMQKLTKAFRVYRLTMMTLVCVVAGLFIGLLCRNYAKDWTERRFMYIEMPGELYFRLLRLIIIPLLVSNVILAFGTIGRKLSSRLGKVATFLYIGAKLLAIAVAILLALIICPEYHNSIRRYSEYHPMFYHSVLREGGYQLDRHSVQLLAKKRLEQPSNSILKSQSIQKINQTRNHENHPSLKKKLKSSILNNTDRQLGSHQNDFILPIDVLLDFLRNLVPDSIIGAALRQTKSRLFAPKTLTIAKNGSVQPPPHSWPIGHELVDHPNIIGLLAISVLTGIILSQMEEASKPMLDLCVCIAELSLRIALASVNLTPICIMFLLIGQLTRSRNLGLTIDELFMYTITVMIALTLHGFIILPLIYYLITKKSPVAFLLGMLEALVSSFATSSSSATMALTLSCLVDLGLNPVIVRAFGPLGSVFNMNGTTIFEIIATIFTAQTIGVELPPTSIALVGLSSAVASISTTGIPSSGMMTIVIVLNAVNLPVLQLSLIYIVDFIIDRFRTVVNVWSGAIVCSLINHICPEHLFEKEMQSEKYSEMAKYRKSTLVSKKSSTIEQEPKPRVISVTITPPVENSSV